MIGLAARLAWRNLRSGELALLSSALVLAVAVVATVAVFTGRLEDTLSRQSNALFGADVIIRSSRALPTPWRQQADALGLKTTRTVQFSSMVGAGDALQLASVRAVGEGYPLRGEVEISRTPFATEADAIEIAHATPPVGEVWVDSRLLPQLGIAIDGKLDIGEAQFRATRVLIAEPDAGSPFSLLGAGLMMNLDDLARTGVVQPGSRVQYQLLVAGQASALAEFLDWVQPRFSEHDKIVTLADTNRGLERTLATGKKFLLLAAVMGVLLAGIAIGISARQFGHRHTDQVALLKSFGISARALRGLYTLQLLILAGGASLLGLVIGECLQRLVAWAVQDLYGIGLVDAHPLPYLTSLFCGFLCLTCFALPAIWHLPRVPPLKILRRELKVNAPQVRWQIGLAAAAIMGLILLFSRDLALALSVMAALVLVVVAAAVCAWLLLRQSRKVADRAGSVWRLATANLYRRLDQSVTQLVVFAVAILLLVTMVVTRQSLIQDWQMKIPVDAPNHFLVNLPPAERADAERFFARHAITGEPFYPMVRGRLQTVTAPDQAAPDPDADTNEQTRSGMNREANLTWASELASDNRLVEGQWWDTWRAGAQGLAGVSVEREFAERAGIAVGNRLKFSIGGLPLEAEVASLRELDWRSMKPNFFFIFEPGSLDAFAATYMTSFYLPNAHKRLINDLISAHPTAIVVEVDKIIQQIQTIVKQVSNGVLLVLILILIAGGLVMASAVNASLALRRQEIGLLRTLGSPRALLLKSLGLEFALLGLIAGILGAFGAEILLLCMQHFVLETPLQPHFAYWLAAPLASAFAICAFGMLLLRRTLDTPPATILREAA